MQFGMPTLIENNDLEEAASLCKELSLDFIELNMNFPQYQIDSLENIDYYQKIADQYGIYYTIHLDENLNFCDFNRAVSKAYFDTVKRTLLVASSLKIPIVNMHLNQGVYVTLPDKKIYLYEKYNNNYMSDMNEYRKMCEETIGDADIKISIENTGGYMDYEKAAIEFLLQSPVFTLTWDIGHSHTAEIDDETFVMSHVDKLVHFHIHDAIGKKNHMTLGSGEIDLLEKLCVAKKYGQRCVIETKTVESLKKSVKLLESLKSWRS